MRLSAPVLLSFCGVTALGCSADPAPFRLVTLNVLHGLFDEDPKAEPFDRFGERFQRVLSALAAASPDAISFQEIQLGTEAGYPDVQAEILEAVGTQYVSIFGDVFGSPAARDARDGGVGQLTLTRAEPSRFENHAVVAVEAFRPRTALHVRVSASLGAVDLFNVHLQGPDDEAAARRELEDVVAFADAAATPEGIEVLAGDFNLSDTAPALSILKDRGFVDGAAVSGYACTAEDRRGCTNETLPLDAPGFRALRRIDAVFVRSRAPLGIACRPIFDQPFALDGGGALWASDHIGVWCELGSRL
ncbi:MAG: endonuclease/exonuclease/phosphatase family protein [Deltaproteobacteria bacterium]|nr:endonuclease/exonuclease/phosphatase family protein [Deltaproteobacteria bacterium]